MGVQEHAGQPSAHELMERARYRLERRGDVSAMLLSDPVARSWQRCLDARLDPLTAPEDLVLGAAGLRHLLDEHAVLRSLARPELELLYQQMAGSNYLLALGTPDGIVTDVLADSACSETKAGQTVIEGSIWSEALRGTNGMGLTVHDRAPRSVWRGEHFFRIDGAVSCIAVPIFDSFGTLAGLLDASTGSDDWHAHTSALLKMSAANIEAGLFHYQQDANSILRVHPRPEYLPTMSAGLLAVDSFGRVVAISRRGREILRLPPDAAAEALPNIFNEDPARLMARLLKRGTVRCGLIGGGEVFVASSHLKAQRAHRVVNPDSLHLAPPPSPPRRNDLGFVANDLRVRAQLDALERVVRRNLPIHIVGENGTGKELLARYIHVLAGRTGRFVAVNCATLGEDDCACVLFGQPDETASGQPQGLIGLADRGTLFLDEVDALPPRVQTALLRFLDTGEIRPVGGAAAYQTDVHTVTAGCTAPPQGGKDENSVPIQQLRLSGFEVTLPPLRDRSDFEDLACAMMDELGIAVPLSDKAMATLRAHPWPGNLRELRGALGVAAALCEGDQIKVQDILRALPGLTAADDPLAASPGLTACPHCRERPLQHNRCVQIRDTYLKENRNAARTARVLGIARSTLYQHIGSLIEKR